MLGFGCAASWTLVNGCAFVASGESCWLPVCCTHALVQCRMPRHRAGGRALHIDSTRKWPVATIDLERLHNSMTVATGSGGLPRSLTCCSRTGTPPVLTSTPDVLCTCALQVFTELEDSAASMQITPPVREDLPAHLHIGNLLLYPHLAAAATVAAEAAAAT